MASLRVKCATFHAVTLLALVAAILPSLAAGQCIGAATVLPVGESTFTGCNEPTRVVQLRFAGPGSSVVFQQYDVAGFVYEQAGMEATEVAGISVRVEESTLRGPLRLRYPLDGANISMQGGEVLGDAAVSVEYRSASTSTTTISLNGVTLRAGGPASGEVRRIVNVTGSDSGVDDWGGPLMISLTGMRIDLNDTSNRIPGFVGVEVDLGSRRMEELHITVDDMVSAVTSSFQQSVHVAFLQSAIFSVLNVTATRSDFNVDGVGSGTPPGNADVDSVIQTLKVGVERRSLLAVTDSHVVSVNRITNMKSSVVFVGESRSMRNLEVRLHRLVLALASDDWSVMLRFRDQVDINSDRFDNPVLDCQDISGKLTSFEEDLARVTFILEVNAVDMVIRQRNLSIAASHVTRGAAFLQFSRTNIDGITVEVANAFFEPKMEFKSFGKIFTETQNFMAIRGNVRRGLMTVTDSGLTVGGTPFGIIGASQFLTIFDTADVQDMHFKFIGSHLISPSGESQVAAFSFLNVNNSLAMNTNFTFTDCTMRGAAIVSATFLSGIEGQLQGVVLSAEGITAELTAGIQLATIFQLNIQSNVSDTLLIMRNSTVSLDAVTSPIANLVPTDVISAYVGRTVTLGGTLVTIAVGTVVHRSSLIFEGVRGTVAGPQFTALAEVAASTTETLIAFRECQVALSGLTSVSQYAAAFVLATTDSQSKLALEITDLSNITIAGNDTSAGGFVVASIKHVHLWEGASVLVLNSVVSVTHDKEAGFAYLYDTKLSGCTFNVSGGELALHSDANGGAVTAMKIGTFNDATNELTDTTFAFDGVVLDVKARSNVHMVRYLDSTRTGVNTKMIFRGLRGSIATEFGYVRFVRLAGAFRPGMVIDFTDIRIALAAGGVTFVDGLRDTMVGTVSFNQVRLDTVASAAVHEFFYARLITIEPGFNSGAPTVFIHFQDVLLIGPSWQLVAEGFGEGHTAASFRITTSCALTQAGYDDEPQLYERSAIGDSILDPATNFVYSPLSLAQQQERCGNTRTPTVVIPPAWTATGTLGSTPSRTRPLTYTRTKPPTLSSDLSLSRSISAMAQEPECVGAAVSVVPETGYVAQPTPAREGSSDGLVSTEIINTDGVSFALYLRNATWSSQATSAVSVTCVEDSASDTSAASAKDDAARCRAFVAAALSRNGSVSLLSSTELVVRIAAGSLLELEGSARLRLVVPSGALSCSLSGGGVNGAAPSELDASVRVEAPVSSEAEAAGAAMTAVGAVAVLGALKSTATMLDAQSVAALGLISCSSRGDRYAMQRASWLLAPGSIGSGPDGAVLFNLVIVASLLLVPLLVSVVWLKAKQRGKKTEVAPSSNPEKHVEPASSPPTADAPKAPPTLAELHVQLRYPALYVKVAMVFHQGTAVLSMRRVFDGYGTFVSVVGMLAALVSPWLLYWLGRVLTRPRFDSDPGSRLVFFKYAVGDVVDSVPASIPGWLRSGLAYWVVPVGKWGPPLLARRFGGTVTSTMPLWTLYGAMPLVKATAVCVVAAVKTGTPAGCMAQYGTLVAMNVLFGIALAIARPYRTGFLNASQSATSFLVGLITLTKAVRALDPLGSLWAATLAVHLLRLMAVFGGLQTIYGFIMMFAEPRIFKKYITKQEWRACRDASDTHALYAKLAACVDEEMTVMANASPVPSPGSGLQESLLTETKNNDRDLDLILARELYSV